MTFEIITLLIAVLGIVLFLLAIKRLWRRKLITASLQGLTGLLLLSLAFLSGSIALNLYSYQQLTQEQSIAELHLIELEPKLYRVFISFSDNRTQTYDIRGDQWQLDARVLKWSGIATVVGMNTLYRFERLTGRYRDINQERSAPRTVFPMPVSDFLANWSPDIWLFIKKYQGWFPWVDAIYGNATYLPMRHQARYTIYVGSSGLIARPSNNEAVSAVRNWQ